MDNSRQTTDHANGQSAAGTKQLSQGASVLKAAPLQDGGASNQGQRVPPKTEGVQHG